MSVRSHFRQRMLSRCTLPLLLLLAACSGGSDSSDQAVSPSPEAPPAETPGTGDSGNTGTPTPTPAPGNDGGDSGTPPAPSDGGGTPPPASGGGGTPGDDTDDPPIPTPEVGQALNDPSCTLQFSYQPAAPEKSGPDPLYAKQWYLHNTGSLPGSKAGEDINVLGAWASVNGAGVRVAVVDTGVDMLHEDLRANIVPGASRNYLAWANGNAYPLPCMDRSISNHGTATASIIAARDNNGLGIRGVAPRASLVIYNALSESTGKIDTRAVKDAFARDLDKNHIYSNSWSAGASQTFTMPPPDLSNTEYRQLIRNARDTGRQGLGTIFVFGAGNAGACPEETPSCSRRLATHDTFLNQPGILSICATTATGTRSSYSEPGANLLVCAPAGDITDGAPQITAADLRNTYQDDFGGTSAAAPMVSGVIALMLQANPQLSWRDVPLILAATARKNDPDNPGWTSLRV